MTHLRIQVGPRGRLPPNTVRLPGERRRSINWPFIVVWGLVFVLWGWVLWRALR